MAIASWCISQHGRGEQHICSIGHARSNRRSDYTLLAEELKKGFTPVKLAAVQSHDRNQGPKESVDEFAQDLKKLFARA